MIWGLLVVLGAVVLTPSLMQAEPKGIATSTHSKVSTRGDLYAERFRLFADR